MSPALPDCLAHVLRHVNVVLAPLLLAALLTDGGLVEQVCPPQHVLTVPAHCFSKPRPHSTPASLVMFEGDADRPAARHVRPGVEPADSVDDDVPTDADHAADHVRDLDRQGRLGLLDTEQSEEEGYG